MSQVTGRTIGRIVTFHTFKLLKQTQIAHQSLSLKLASNLGGWHASVGSGNEDTVEWWQCVCHFLQVCFSHSADVYFHHQNCHVRSHSSSWFSVACATPLVIFLTSCLLHLVRQSFCWNCFRDSDFGIATLWFIGFYISFIYFVTPIHCSYQLGLYF